MRDLPARPVVRRFTRLLTALAAAIGLTWLPVATVDACTCLGWTFPQSIRAADIAFTGTVSDVETDFGVAAWETTRVSFGVARSKDELATPFIVDTPVGSSASSGLDMAVGQEWLVLAHVDDGGRPQTNLCTGSTVLAALDEPTLQIVMNELAAEPMPADAEVSDAGWASNVPLPVLVAGAGALVILAASALAFRKPRPG
jgi:hypothetical protein